MLPNSHLSCAKTVFLERSVLVFATLVTISQIVDYCSTKNAFALTMDEDYLLTLFVLILLHYLVEVVLLIVQNLNRLHARSKVYNLVCMKVNDDDFLISDHLCTNSFNALSVVILRRNSSRQGFLYLLPYPMSYLHFWLSHAVVFYDWQKHGVLVEEVVLRERSNLVELSAVYSKFHVNHRTSHEHLSLLI